jgi:tRNA(fMet)-specific endonuclease VapC
MKFLLDTNICIYLIRQKPLEVLQKFNTYKVGDIGISSLRLLLPNWNLAFKKVSFLKETNKH